MSKKTRHTRTTIERHEVTIIRQRGKQRFVYCERCQAEVRAMTADELAVLRQLSVDDIGAMVKRGDLHFIETAAGNLPLICGGLLIQ